MTERLLLVSDTHGDLRSILSYIRRTPGIDRILHLGDHAWDAEEMQQMLGRVVLGVRGNNDWGSPAPRNTPFLLRAFRCCSPTVIVMVSILTVCRLSNTRENNLPTLCFMVTPTALLSNKSNRFGQLIPDRRAVLMMVRPAAPFSL